MMAMRNTKRSIQSTVTIDGFSMMWELHREQNWSADQNPTGMAIHVRVEGPRRWRRGGTRSRGASRLYMKWASCRVRAVFKKLLSGETEKQKQVLRLTTPGLKNARGPFRSG